MHHRKLYVRPTLSPDDFDLAVVVSFGYFLPKSLIRSYRGSAPIEHTLLNGDKETGVSIIELDETRFDAGRILNQTVSKVDPETDFLKLHNSLADIGAELLIETIKDLDKFKVEAKDQDETLVTRAPKISKDMASIDWNTMNSDQILRMFNALSYRYPPYTHFNNNQVQLLQISSALPDDEFAKSKLNSERPSGTMIFDKKTNHLYIKCRDDWIQCTKLKVQNKNAVPPKDFANGYNLKDGDYFVIQ
ncbi:hypothetical protein HK098_000328 [Nowakowskiella sp. JEL0407]|nr:hypothetical protein HK098_000328 [Nowakowskiella sp. JEL0407]